VIIGEYADKADVWMTHFKNYELSSKQKNIHPVPALANK
jgi:hypothetical protein